MAKWTDYAEKEGIADNDEIIILDKETNTNKRSIVSNIVNVVVEKIASHKFSGLNTADKTLVGAINEVDAKNTEQDEKISALESDINEAGTKNTEQDEKISTLESRANESDTKNTEQDERLEAVENELSTFLKKTDVDSTLSVSGSPADAKAVGDALKKDKEAIAANREQIATNKEDIGSLKEDLAEYVFSKTKNVNLLDIDDSDVQYGFYNSTNGEYTANGNALTSGFIPYESDSVYRFTFPTDWFNYSVSLWDENKLAVPADLSSFISKENGYATFSSTTYSNAKYVRFTIFDQSKDFSTAMVVKDVEYPSAYIPYGYTVKYSKKLDREIENIAKNINPVTIFDNKVMLFTGDSICYGVNWRPTVEDYSNTGWRKIIQENYPKSITYGYGIGGTTISKRSGRTDSILERMTTMFSEHPEADYIIIEGGVNDAYNITDCPIGTISTGYTAELNENTFAGALESIFKYAQTNWIGKKIGYIVTFKVPSAMGQFKFNEYMDIAKQICEKWSIPYCDLYNESNLNYYIQEVSNAYGGGLHPNEAGYRIITNKIEKWLETL